METKSYAEHTLDEMRSDCNYHPEKEGDVDDLIAYKDALEDKLCDVLAAFARIASRTGGSAADVAEEVYGELYGLGYRTELPDDEGEFIFPPPDAQS